MSLTQEIAIARTGIIRKNSIFYNCNIVLGTDQYSGLTEIIFYIDNTNFQQLYVDFSPTLIQSINVNSVQFPIPESIDNFLVLPRKYLQKGRNYISVLYTNDYDNDGLGCLTFRDDNDQQYVYTQFQTYGANRVFPCFDQPDLKATMKLSIVAPSEWTVLSNQPPTTKNAYSLMEYKKLSGLQLSSSTDMLKLLTKNVSNDTSITSFETTQLLSTYVFGFSAGEFVFQTPDQPYSVPMNIYAVSSAVFLLAKSKDFIFDVIQKAMDFFQTYFGLKYPFKKYDIVFLRELNFTAMQNAGMVTFTEEYLLRNASTLQDKYNLANVLIHELTHHWFGNYVTMQWWDDLWLNQSFAEFMAAYTLQRINDSLNQPMQPSSIYFKQTKYGGYIQDQRNSATHPIRGKVPDTTVADSIFDGITYNKGAAVLKQLMFLVQEENFSTALQNYFSRFAWSNATIFDLLQDISPFFPADINITIDQWRQDWLETASLNVLESMWDPTKTSTNEDLVIYQSPYRSTDSNLRCHAIEIAFLDDTGTLVDAQKVILDKNVNNTHVTYDGSLGVVAVLVNYNDFDFVENYIDQVSLQWFMANINKIQDDLIRSCIWYNIGSMVRQSLVSVNEFATMIEVFLFDEMIDFIFDKMLDQLFGFINTYTSKEEGVRLKTTIFDQIYQKLKTGELGEAEADRVQILYKHYINFAVTDSQKMKLNYFLQDKDLTNITSIIEIQNQLCWEIVKKVFTVSSPQFRLTDQDKWAVFEYMQGFDKSYRADDTRQVCQAILATEVQYQYLFNQLLVPGFSLTLRYLVAQGLTNEYNEQNYYDNYRRLYFNSLVDPKVYNNLSYYQFRTFYNKMRPQDADYSNQVTKYQQVLSVLSEVPSMAAHCINITKVIDDLTMKIENSTFNADSNLTLTKIRADQRYSYIQRGSISYISNITYTPLNGTESTYSGLTEITFTLNSLPKLLPIDFDSKQVTDLIVNGVSVPAAQHDQFLIISRVYLQLGINHVQVNYVNFYNNDGLGCMGYTDMTSGSPQYYTYTQFQPYFAHKFFPCFDQPNLKATASFNVIVPDGWIAVANNPSLVSGAFVVADYLTNAPAHNNPNLLTKYLSGKSGTYYIFDRTEFLPTYLYCVVAGQYYSIVAKPEQLYNSIPMTLYSLRSNSTSLDMKANFIFEVTNHCLSLQSKFGIPYKFKKYDSVFCHEYKFGAMENPGLITFSDTQLPSEEVSVRKLADFASLIAHQCAHNWFGNYVTMSWWDDLWLNESFADFISYYCIDHIKDSVPEFKGLTSGWLGAQQYAVKGYRQDQITSTTHPVRSVVPNTDLALRYFDGITYQKGSMILKQLMFLMGEDNFFNGLKSYFSKYGFNNATIDEFLAEMGNFFTESYFTLQQWKNMWILTPSLNVITATWDSSSTSKTAKLYINQQNYTEVYNMLRYHMVNVAFFKADGSYTIQKILIKNQPQTQVEYDASVGVVAILVNQGHQSFLKYRFDKKSQNFFINNMNLIDESFTRMIIYFYLNEQIRDGYLNQKVVDYIDSVKPQLQTQTEDIVFQYVLRFLNTATNKYLPSAGRESARAPLFDFVRTSLQQFGKYEQKLIKLRQSRQRSRLIRVKPNRYRSRMPRLSLIRYPRKPLQILSDSVNRELILKDLLPLFCPINLSQVGILKSWLEGTYAPLNKYPISPSQGWALVKLIYAVQEYTLDQKTAAFSLQKSKHPGIQADLINFTCLNLIADDQQMQDTYTNIFKTQTESITVKKYIAQGWNNAVHQDILLNNFKKRIFTDIPALSTQLSSEHFSFFYTYLEPIDDELQTTINYYHSIKLVGSDMLGHINTIKQIEDQLQVRKKLYAINTL